MHFGCSHLALKDFLHSTIHPSPKSWKALYGMPNLDTLYPSFLYWIYLLLLLKQRYRFHLNRTTVLYLLPWLTYRVNWIGFFSHIYGSNLALIFLSDATSCMMLMLEINFHFLNEDVISRCNPSSRLIICGIELILFRHCMFQMKQISYGHNYLSVGFDIWFFIGLFPLPSPTLCLEGLL